MDDHDPLTSITDEDGPSALMYGLPSTIPDHVDLPPSSSAASEGEKHASAVREFKEYLRETANDPVQEVKLTEAMENYRQGKECTVRVFVDLDQLVMTNKDLAWGLLHEPVVFLRAAQEALQTTMAEKYPDRRDVFEKVKLRIGVVGSFGRHAVSARGLTSAFLSKMVFLEGIVTKMGSVKPKLVKSVHFVPKTMQRTSREYRDATSLDGLPTSTAIPTTDQNGNPMELEFGDSEYVNHQKLTIQEMPERAPLGQLPRSVEIVCEDDLADQVKPGDRIQCTGIFRALASGQVQDISGTFRTLIVCNSIQAIKRENAEINMTHDDVSNIHAESDKPDVFERISRSLAPSIYGHEYIKKAILLLLLGGEEHILQNGAHLRGDINILIVGDPGVAKSQMLRFVLGVAPLAISTTGRGSTGVGLTAAVTSDPDSGERRLEAGAMVLADRGVVLIDEFDKMGDADRVAIHEVMEQQTVTIAKAGIHASLNARCSVVAAANPIYGSYDKLLTPQRNIGLPDSLLSRFDLLFVVLDNTSAEDDRRVADHVLRMHRYQIPGEEGKPLALDRGAASSYLRLQRQSHRYGDEGEDDDDQEDREMETSLVFVPPNRVAPVSGSGCDEKPAHHPAEEFYTTDFIRKYIRFAKGRTHPVLSNEAVSIIAEEYEELRQDQVTTKTLPITPRCLETMIRLATAHAKCRLSSQVEQEDCAVAREVLRYALYNDTETFEKRKRDEQDRRSVEQAKKLAEEEESELGSKKSDFESDAESDADASQDRKTKSKKKSKKQTSGKKRLRMSSGILDKSPADDDSSERAPAVVVGLDVSLITDERKEFLGRCLMKMPQASSETKISDVIIAVNIELANAKSRKDPSVNNWPDFTLEECKPLLRILETDNVLMYREDFVFCI